MSRRSMRRVRKRIGGGVESDREGVRSRARYVERIAPVSRSDVDRGAPGRAGELRELTDVHIHESFADQLTHGQMLTRDLFLPRRVDRLVGVLNEPLRAADGPRDVVTAVEITQVLRGLERLLERGLREAQRRPEPLELTLIDLSCGHRGKC